MDYSKYNLVGLLRAQSEAEKDLGIQFTSLSPKRKQEEIYLRYLANLLLELYCENEKHAPGMCENCHFERKVKLNKYCK